MIVTDLRFYVHILNENNYATYNEIILENWGGIPQYIYEYFSHHKKPDRELIYFQLTLGNDTLAIMPMVKRKIPLKVENKVFYDVISPYGYSGPLFKEEMDLIGKIHFWEFVDNWYQSNNIVSEFVRFNLHNNQLGYTGEIVPTLKNIVGKILPNQETQWQNYSRKVRNNYRKAIDHGLKAEIIKGDSITDDQLKTFYTLYLNFLNRKNASENYFFPYSHFETLIKCIPESVFLAFALKDDLIIASELLIVHERDLFGYLAASSGDHLFCRPNDFLRVEIIKWASKLQIETYILGGGMTDDDGLYRHKKSFFPKDPDKEFLTGRKIINKNIYNELLKMKYEANMEEQLEVNKNNYFPSYRY